MPLILLRYLNIFLQVKGENSVDALALTEVFLIQLMPQER